MRTAPSTAPALPEAPSLGPEDLEHLLRQAYVHLSRYFHSWLSVAPGGATLADELALEALDRIARAPETVIASDEVETTARVLDVAYRLARELSGA